VGQAPINQRAFNIDNVMIASPLNNTSFNVSAANMCGLDRTHNGVAGYADYSLFDSKHIPMNAGQYSSAMFNPFLTAASNPASNVMLQNPFVANAYGTLIFMISISRICLPYVLFFIRITISNQAIIEVYTHFIMVTLII